MSDINTLLVRVEGTLWAPGQLWENAVAHLATRFSRVTPLDVTTVPAPEAHGLAAATAVLADWAGTQIDWGRELARYFDEHLSMHVRPDPSVSRGMRALGRDRTVLAYSALPHDAVGSVLRHAGVIRAFADVLTPAAGVEAAVALARDRGYEGPFAEIASTADLHVTPPT